MKESKRISGILFCLLPLVIAIVIQNLISIPAVGISAAITFLENYKSGISPQELMNLILETFSASSFTLGISAAYACIALVLFAFWYRKRLAAQEEQVALRHAFNPWIVGAMALLALGMQYLSSYLISFLAIIRPDWISSYENLVKVAGFDKLSPILILYSCIIAPFSEEMIFRGVTFGYAKKYMSIAAAVCYQAFLFGVFHMNIVQGIYAALIGVMLGYVRQKGGTLAISILLHSLFNFCGVFLTNYMFYGSGQPFFFLLWLTVGVLLIFGGLFLFQYGLALRDDDSQTYA